MDQREFFKHIFRDGTGWACITLPGHDGKPTDDHWFEYPRQLDDMQTFVSKNVHTDVWYSPVLFSAQRRVKENGQYLAVAAADADTCDPDNFRMQPSLVVQTSTGRWHVYWGLDGAQAAQDVAKVNRRISHVHKDEGCDISFVNSAKLLRVPGTSNGKHPGEVVVVTAEDSLAATPLSAIELRYPQSEVPDMVEADDDELPSGLADYIRDNRSALLNQIPNSISMQELLFGTYQEDRRSEVRFKLLCALYELGFSDSDVVTIAWGAPSNKYREDPRGLSGLWSEAMKAKAQMRAHTEQSDEYDRPFTEREYEAPEPVKKRERSVFLTDDEIEQVKSQINFIDQWVSWARKKTDAPSEYHRAAAMTIMSAVYSEFGHAIPKFAPKGLKLNLWFMTLGRSTKDRKSTSRSYMNAIFRELKDDVYDYGLPEDVTPGGISLALNDRAHKASVFDRDEVQGLFKEILSQGYMTGSLEVFTKLYDGWSGGRLRASGERKMMESVPVSFIMYTMGILAQTAATLTVDNFRSGFLTRFIYVIAERPEGFKSDPMEQASEEEEQEDQEFGLLVRHLSDRRRRWELRVPERGKTHPMRVDPDAWARFQAFEADVNRKAESSSQGDLIETTAQRMIISVLKLACLIAMDDNASRVRMIHMLQAISYAGEWFDGASTVASMVSASEWERDVDALESYIMAKGGRSTSAAVHREFKNKKGKDIEDMINALVARGTLSRHASGPRWILELEKSDDA